MALRAIYYDTETTGIKAENDRVIELAAYDPERDKTFDQLINPECPIPAEATAIHNISDEMVADKPKFSEIVESFKEFCEGDVVLIAHNNDNFDIHFLRKEFERAGHDLPDWKFLDSLKWARRYRPDLPRHALQFLREIYCLKENNAHRALDDVIMLHEIFKMMTDDLEVQQIYDLLKKPRLLQHMPFGKHQGKPLKQVPKDYIRWLAESGAFEKPGNEELKLSLEKLGMLEELAAPVG
jgi:DNA polymerase-3 subunit epsilon